MSRVTAVPEPAVEVIKTEDGRQGRPGAYRYVYDDGRIEVFLGVTQAAALLGIERKTLIALRKQHPTELKVYRIINSSHCYSRDELLRAKAKYLSGPVEVTEKG